MFTRIFALFMAVLLVVTGVVTSLCWMTLRDQQINARLDELKQEAREIAYLAAQDNASYMQSFMGFENDWRQYLSYKATSVYNEFGAYILVVDRRGNVMDNMRAAYKEDPGFVNSLNHADISDSLVKVMAGEEISVSVMVDNEPTFTVGVPFVQRNTVLGAVLIQTKRQTIEAGMEKLLVQVIGVAVAATLVAALCVFLYVRTLLKPLRQLTKASRGLAEGNFDERVEVARPSPEIANLAATFNMMADKLSETEMSRREFVANVSHELRSPITAISGFVQGMEDGTIPQEEHPKCLAIVSDETRRLSKLIGDLLALSRLEKKDAELNISRFDVCEMLRRAIICRMNDLEKKQLEIECDFEEDAMYVEADSDRIDQVVVNLLDNAIKFTPEGGLIRLICKADGHICSVTVADNGVGIVPEDRGRVFDRFFTVDRAHTSGKGTGLGLSICQRIMQMHGQTIRLEDTETGTAFTITLARAQ